MKKILSLALAVCMLFATLALAEGVVVQNEQPPVLVPVDETVLANVYNANGEQIAQITETGDIVLTDVHARAEAAEDIATRLTDAYEGVMEDVHHSDVKCELHDHDIKVDINTILESMNQNLDAYDLIMFELFDVDFSDDVEAQLTDGSYVRLTVQLDENQPLPIIVLYSNDGADWSVIPYTSNAPKQMTVELPASGTLALLCNGCDVVGIGKEFEDEGDDDGDDGDDGFTPSVGAIELPALDIFTDDEGNEYSGKVSTDDSTESVLVPNLDYIILTTVAKSPENIDVQTYEHIQWAYDIAVNTEDVGNFPSDTEEKTIAAALDQLLEDMGLELKHDQLVVKDVFEISAYGDYLEYLYNEKSYLDVTLITDLDPSKPVFVLHSMDSVNWHAHPAEDVIMHEDGKLTLHLYELGTVALLVEADEAVLDTNEAVQAP